MRSKLSWIPFILLLPAAGFLKLAQGLFPEGLFGLNALQLDYLYMGASALMFILALIFCLTDKRIAPYYLPHRNIFAGLTALLLALSAAADGAGVLIRVFTAGEKDTLTVIGGVTSLIGAVVFIILGLNHMISNTDRKRFSLMYTLPALLFGVRMIQSFVSFTTISIRLADVSNLICYVFAVMFFFYFAVVLSMIRSKNAVRFCFVFGLPGIVAMIPYGVYHLMFGFDADNFLIDLQPVEILLIGLYILSVLIEMTIFVKDKDSVEIGVEEEEETDLSEKKVEGFFANNITEDENDAQADDPFIGASDTEGFLYQEVENPNDNDSVIAAESEADSYLTEVIDEDASDNPYDTRPRRYEDSLDDIDKLILEISEKID